MVTSPKCGRCSVRCASRFTVAVGALSVTHPATALTDKELQEAWWDLAHTEVRMWDHSWLTLGLVCGFRFQRNPVSHRRPIIEAAGLSNRLFARNVSWIFDGTAFQRRALDYYEGRGPPPMSEVWLLMLFASVPKSNKKEIADYEDLSEIACNAVYQLAYKLYVEYLTSVVPPAIFLKYSQVGFAITARATDPDSPIDHVQRLYDFKPLGEAFMSLKKSVDKSACIFGANPDPSCPRGVVRPRVDVVIARCREDLAWAGDWLGRVLRDEWTPEVPRARLRFLVFERCMDASGDQDVLSGATLVAELLRLGAVETGSEAFELPEPPGFENVAYVHYCRERQKWGNADFTIFLHGAPADHLDMQTLDDVLRAMSLGTYDVPFLHLNAKRTPLAEVEPCVHDLLGSALDAWGKSIGDTVPVQLPVQMATYCCSQFVVSRARLRHVPDAFWDVIWQNLQRHEPLPEHGEKDLIEDEDMRLRRGEQTPERLPATCVMAVKNVFESHHRHNSSAAASHGLWAIVLERMWHWLFGEPADLPIRETNERLPLFLRVTRARSTIDGGPRGAVEDLVSLPDWGFDPGYWGAGRAVRNCTGKPMLITMSPVPTSHFAAVARYGWPLPPALRMWLQPGGTFLAQPLQASAF